MERVRQCDRKLTDKCGAGERQQKRQERDDGWKDRERDGEDIGQAVSKDEQRQG